MMKIRAIKALTLLTAYLLSTVGMACLALSCHCPHSFYNNHTQLTAQVCTAHCCHAHDHGEHGESLCSLSGNDCCRHNHSTDTQLYTADSDGSVNIRIAAAPADATSCTPETAVPALTEGTTLSYERRCPPAQKSRTLCRALRAPPVCA